MRVRRLLTTLLVATLAGSGIGLVAGSAPATAATPTTIVGANGDPWLSPASSYKTQPGAEVYGDKFSLAINVKDSSGNQVFDGTLTVQRQLKGSSAWTTVATADSAFLYKDVKAVGNSTYRVLYSGSGDYAPSSATKAVKVQRALNEKPVTKGNKLFLKGKVAPKYSKKKVTIQKRVGKKWKKFSTVKTDRKGHFTARVKAPAKRGGKVPYRIYIKKSKTFDTTTSQAYIATKY